MFGFEVAKECILVMAIFSKFVGGGRRFNAVRASIVLPDPGGPAIRILWWPAMAIVRARLAWFCPQISSSTN